MAIIPELPSIPELKLAKPTIVTLDNFVRAESDLVFGGVGQEGGFGAYSHHREPIGPGYPIVRPNRDTLYSLAVFDLDAGPVTVTLPDAGDRFMSMMVSDEDEYISSVHYGAGSYRFTRDQIGTRYVAPGIRIFVNPNDPEDIKKVHALQDAIKVSQPGGPGKFDVPQWDKASQDKVRSALKALAETMPDFRSAFGSRSEVDPVRHLVGAAAGYGGNPDKDAVYLNAVPGRNDGKTAYVLSVKDVPVDGFWSVTVYNRQGSLIANKFNAYSFNNITAKKDADGSVTIQFGGDPAVTANCLPIEPGWNYTVRLYRPRPEILRGKWQFPEAQPMQ
jgi:hypothetical protein